MSSAELVSFLPLVLAALVPAPLVVAAFLMSRRRAGVLNVAVVVTTIAAALAYLAVFLHPAMALLGFDPRIRAKDSGLNDVVQLDLVTSCMFVLVATIALVVTRYARSYLAGPRGLDRFARAP